MVSSLQISQSLLKKLSKIRKPTLAKLYGIFFENTTILLAIQVTTKDKIEFEYSLPTEIDLYGLVSIDDKELNHNEIIVQLREQIDVTDNPIYLSTSLEDTNIITSYFLRNEQLQKINFRVVSEQEIFEQLVYLHINGIFPVYCASERSSYDNAMLELSNLATTGSLAFNFPKTPIYMLGSHNEVENNILDLSNEPILSDICENCFDDYSEKKRKKDSSGCSMIVLDINIFRKVSKENGFSSGKEHAPICIVNNKEKTTAQIPVKIDCLALVSKQTSLNSLYDILVESVVKNIKSFHKTLLKSLDEKKELILPEVYHFYPSGCDHFISLWIPKAVDESLLESSRKALHETFLLPVNRPLLRRGNKYSFDNSNANGILMNPHETVKNTNNGGKIVLVQGNYLYYHYNQQGMDDNGWGCAYRSLQTLASWFKLQGYTDKEVPTFREIQKTLVDIEDKPSSFLGSRQWIGSMEVNFVLNTLLGVTCRIINVSNGASMAYEGPELIRHFEQYGSPIMIGGGNLAHTILGVDYNETTGDIKFLILDPHYTGSDDLQTIKNKGWCGWKGVEFWNKSSYYNMCLPIVPHAV